ncbi:hypothetical protein ABPG72_007490 [Tetrahymena utriculariae]
MSKTPLPQNQINPQTINQTPGQPPQQQQQQQQIQRVQQQQQGSYQTGAMKIIESAIILANKMKEELKQKKPSNPEQKLRDAIKKHFSNQEKYLRNLNNQQLEDQRKLLKLHSHELLACIQMMTKNHQEKKTEIEQNINKNIELLKYLQNYKTINQNFQERENSQQQAPNSYNPNDDSFDQIVYEAQKEIKSQYNQTQSQYQVMDQEQQYYYQGNETQNNEMLDRNSIQNMEYAEDNIDYQYI